MKKKGTFLNYIGKQKQSDKKSVYQANNTSSMSPNVKSSQGFALEEAYNQ